MNFFKKLTHAYWLPPILFAIFPVIALWENNYSRMDAIEVVLPLLEAVLAALILYFSMKLVFRNALKASLLCTFLLLLYFTYGHVYDLIDNKAIFGLLVGRHRVLMVVWLLIFLAGSYAILRYGARASELAFFLNRAGLVLLAFSVIQLVYLQVNTFRLKAQHAQVLDAATGMQSTQSSPDIYLIVLDAYMRSDVLQRDLGYDNTAFMKQLTDLGFVIPSCAMSNYAYTAMSMSSELNMEYVEQFSGPLDPNSPEIDYAMFTEYIIHSQVREQLQKLGYKIVSFQGGFPWVEIRDADYYYRPKISTNYLKELLSSSEFSQMLSASTLFRIVIDAEIISPAVAGPKNQVEKFIKKYTRNVTKDVRDSYQKRYDFIVNSFEIVQDAINLPDRKFVYLHIPAPHPPWLVDINGKYLRDKVEKTGYTAEVSYLNKQVIPLLKSIIQHSKNPPVIILQADHGWGDVAARRMYILNAYYLPDAANVVYSTITPVNTFRTIFNTYFGGKYPLLPDESFYSPLDDFYDFVKEPQACPK